MKALKSLSSIIKTLLEAPQPAPNIEWIEVNKEKKTSHNNYKIPKIIWIYWDTPHLPKTVEICINQARLLHPKFSIILTNKETIKEHIDIPTITAKLPEANIADYIRLALLSKHGGIWMDASIFMTEDLTWITSKMHNQDSFLFFSDECTSDKKKPIPENWLIACPRDSEFIRDWLNEYKKCITSSNPKTYYSNITDRKTLLQIQNLTKPDYLLAYISAIVVLEAKKYKILYASSANTGYYFNYRYSWKKTPIAINLLIKNKNKITPTKLTKLTAKTRNNIESLISKGIYTKKSLLGEQIKRAKKLNKLCSKSHQFLIE